MHFNRNFSFQEVLKWQMVYYGEILAHLKGGTPLKLVWLIFIFILLFLRSFSVGATQCEGASHVCGSEIRGGTRRLRIIEVKIREGMSRSKILYRLNRTKAAGVRDRLI